MRGSCAELFPLIYGSGTAVDHIRGTYTLVDRGHHLGIENNLYQVGTLVKKYARYIRLKPLFCLVSVDSNIACTSLSATREIGIDRARKGVFGIVFSFSNAPNQHAPAE